MKHKDLIVIGGGAAGVFGALRFAELVPKSEVLILEKAKRPLEKVKISGGGRCNVTHGIFEPRELVKFYPRGSKELLGPFNTFMTGDMMGWLSDHGVETKIEVDGRVFPVSDDSQSIIDCFMKLIRDRKVKLNLSEGVREIKREGNHWIIESEKDIYSTKAVLMTTGSSPLAWKMLKPLNIEIVDPVPSLFTFNIQSPLLKDLMGLSVPNAEIKISGTKLSDHGPLLITHWGLSGPAVLKLSAWGARILNEKNYQFEIRVNWTLDSDSTVDEWMEEQRRLHPKRAVNMTVYPEIPKRLWHRMCQLSGVNKGNWADQRKKDLTKLKEMIINCTLSVNGKSTFKEEFVTAGGVKLKQVDFKRMELKAHPGLHLAGEVLNIDALTGGFNFQAAWTGSWVAANAIAEAVNGG